MPKMIDDRPADVDSDAPGDGEQLARQQLARQQAIKQMQAMRRFKISTAAAAVGMTLLVPIWATTEYHNAGGWPTDGFSQRSGTRQVWNIWIIYPVIAWVLLTAARGWLVYGRKPISESESEREMEGQTEPSH